MGEPINVPLLDLSAQNQPLAAELKAAFARVLDSSQFILGPEVAGFESVAAESVGAKHAIGVSSGTDALLLSLMTLGIGPGDEVLCPSFTFFATAGAIARTGATPVFVDSLDADFNIDLAAAAGRVTDKTKAIIPVHLFGQAADMDGVQRLAKAHDLAVLEDAAQSMGATFGGQPVGTMGDLGAFSFFPSKNLGGFGDGGMITTDDDGLAKRARLAGVGVDDACHHARQRMPDAAALAADLPEAGRAKVARVDRHHRRGLRRAVTLHRSQPEAILERRGQALRQFLRAGQDQSKRAQLSRGATSHVKLQEGGCGQQNGHPVAMNEITHRRGIQRVGLCGRVGIG